MMYLNVTFYKTYVTHISGMSEFDPIPTKYTGCFKTCVYYCRRWFPRSLWSKKFI